MSMVNEVIEMHLIQLKHYKMIYEKCGRGITENELHLKEFKSIINRIMIGQK